MVFKWRRLEEISVYHQHTVGVRGHALLWSGLCVRYGKVFNKCTMSFGNKLFFFSGNVCFLFATANEMKDSNIH